MKRMEWDTAVWTALGGLIGTTAAIFLLPVWIPGLTASILDETVYWLLARVGGFISYGLLWLSVVFGLLLSSRTAQIWPGMRRANVFHQDISLLALIYIFSHALILMGDRYIGFSVFSLLIPFGSPYKPVAVGLGQAGAWLTVLITLSHVLRKRIGTRIWRSIHYLTFPVYLLVLIHALLAGTDSQTPWALGIYISTAVITYTLTVYRVLVKVKAKTGKQYGSNRKAQTGQTSAGRG
ncbi:MAG: ferric reductase-like transmembrane domain-containing protein [Anaerolineales bacterium]|nr:ferric reductase-like transmembrane domain-containing protein [Anaerolineales bacterium]